MQFREVTWAQQLNFQRLLHGPGAEVTERSLPNYPGAAMREIIRQSGHPHNLEPLLLTLRRPANAAARRRFAEVGGELVLIQKVTSAEPVATDFKMAVHGRVVDAPDGMLYPVQGATTTYETWLRVEMLDILRLMIEENLVRSLLPEMQAKLVADMLLLHDDGAQHELLRLYAFGVAVAALKRFHAARPVALRAGFGAKAAAVLRALLLGGPHPPSSIYNADPFEQLKALSAAVEALYVAALCDPLSGEYVLAAGSGAAKSAQAAQDAAEQAVGARAGGTPDTAADTAAAAAAAGAGAVTLGGCKRSMGGLQGLAQLEGTGQLLAAAATRLWQLLQARDSFTYTPPSTAAAKGKAATAGRNTAAADSNGSSNGDGQQQAAEGEAHEDEQGEEEDDSQLTKEQRQLKAAAQEAIAAANLSFDENWQLFLKTVYDTQLVPLCAGASLQLAAALLQLLAHAQAGSQPPELPDAAVLAAMARASSQPVLAITGSCLAATRAAAAAAAAAASGDVSAAAAALAAVPAIMGLPGHEDAEFACLAKTCCTCNKAEGREVKLLRCAQCGLVYYCSSQCQKVDWKMGHKGLCKNLQEWRDASAGATLEAAPAAIGGGGA